MVWESAVRHEQRDPRERLTSLVRGLVRARRWQIVTDIVWTGTLASLGASFVAVLAARVFAQQLDLWLVAASVVGVGLVTSAFVALGRKVDSLQTAIAADLKLNLKQRLSTAWEFATQDAADPRTRALAARAFRVRYPARPSHVFPLHFNTSARFVPVALIALAVAVFFDPQTVVSKSRDVADAQVVLEGAMLGDFGRQLEARARRKKLTRSAVQARRLQQLGSRMESGLVSRSEALDRLRPLRQEVDKERLAALSEGVQTPTGPLRIESVSGGGGGIGALRSALEQMLRDGKAPSKSQRSQLESLGVPSDELRSAMDDLARGDEKAMRELINKLDRLERDEQDAQGLDEAGKAIDRARRNLDDETLGNDQAGRPDGERFGGGPAPGESERESPGALADDFEPGEGGSGGAPGSSMPPDRNNSRARAMPAPSESGATVVISPRGQLGEGEVFSSQARVLPESNTPLLERREVSADYRAQLESVMSEGAYPPHRKAFLRRYFLNISEGANASGRQP
jgi:hypothetical protein